MEQQIEDKGDGIKVTTIDPKIPNAESQWRKAYLKELRSINGKMTWFVVLLVLSLLGQFIGWLMSPVIR
jgi:hypothetical protein